MQLSRLHKYQNQWRWHMLVPFEVGLHLVTASPMYASTTRSGFLFLFFSWGHTLLTGVTVGNMSAFTDKLDWWIDPWFNSAGCQEQQISIHLVKKTPHSTPVVAVNRADGSTYCIHAVFIIKLTHCFRDSECEHGKCHFNYIAFIPLKAIVAGCKGTTKYP